jgi:hypothetical protein
VFIADGYFHVTLLLRSWAPGPVEMETLGSAKGFIVVFLFLLYFLLLKHWGMGSSV